MDGEAPEREQFAVRAGDVVGGKYLVRRELGRGGMGVVLEAEHMQLGHRVALKFLATAFIKSPKAVARFVREGRAAVRIESEHVARMLDVGALDTGQPYLAMEFLEGEDLGQILERRGKLSVADAVDYVLQACEAVAEAHSLGIVHRDLKPANLFLTKRRDGSSLVKVLDFGISKAMEEAPGSPSMTATAVVLGSPQYMSPEQIRSSKHVDRRTDIWALGTILYELVCNKSVFEAESLTALCVMIASEPVTPLRHKQPDAPAAFEAVVMRCLEKEQDRRYQSVAELGQALLPFGPKWAPMMVERMTNLLGLTDAPRAPGQSAAAASTGLSTSEMLVDGVVSPLDPQPLSGARVAAASAAAAPTAAPAANASPGGSGPVAGPPPAYDASGAFGVTTADPGAAVPAASPPEAARRAVTAEGWTGGGLAPVARPRSRGVLVAVIASVVLLCAVGGFFAFRASGASSSAAGTPSGVEPAATVTIGATAVVQSGASSTSPSGSGSATAAATAPSASATSATSAAASSPASAGRVDAKVAASKPTASAGTAKPNPKGKGALPDLGGRVF